VTDLQRVEVDLHDLAGGRVTDVAHGIGDHAHRRLRGPEPLHTSGQLDRIGHLVSSTACFARHRCSGYGAFPPEYFDETTNATIADITSLGEDLDESGHLQISQEVILELEPDLVLGQPDGIDAEGLRAVGIPLIEQPANCPGGLEGVGLETIYEQVELYGEVFGVPQRADEVLAELRDRVADVEAAAAEVGEGRVAAARYPTVGGGTTYAYGNRSFPDVLLRAAGFTNAFGDTDERVFEVATEELLDRDPEVLVLLHVDGEPGPVADAVRQLPGTSGMAAIAEERVLVQLFNFAEYPSPLVIDGLEQLVAAFGDGA
jgi:iron complex transport system substrate-binding protein